MAISVEDVRIQLKELLNFFNPIHSLANTYLGSFFTENLWESYVPKTVQEELNHVNGINHFIRVYPKLITGECPEDFACKYPGVYEFVNKSINISIIKQEKYFQLLSHLKNVFINKDDLKTCGVDIKSFMTSKKSHEVKIMSEMVSCLYHITRSSHVIDIGGGKGYLSCAIACNCGFKVLGLDCSEVTTCGAIKRSDKLARFLNEDCFKADQKDLNNKKARQEFLKKHYKQAIAYVKPDTDAEGLVKDSFNEEVNGITLTGLHTCGDLAVTCLRLFLKSQQIKCVLNVGCCYNKITEEFSKDNSQHKNESFGFPISQFLRDKNCKLGEDARMAACYSVDRICINENFETSQNLLFYRALFECFLKSKNLPKDHFKVGSAARKSKNFQEYMSIALQKLDIIDKVPETEISELFNIYLARKPYLTAYYLLRASLAPVIESIILLDRFLYLMENNVNNVYLVPLFDLEISPRGFGIISWKDS